MQPAVPYGDPTVGKRILDSLGYWSVSIICALSGYILSSEQLPSVNSLILMSAYIVVLAPYFLSREALLERVRPEYDRTAISDGIQTPLIFLFLVSCLSFLLLYLFYTPNITNQFGKHWDGILAILIGFAPFAVLWVLACIQLRKEEYNRAYKFSEKILFPAIYTCFVPFSFGWAISGNQIDFNVLFLAAGYVVTLKIVASWLNVSMGWLVGGQFAAILAFLIGVRLSSEELFIAVLYGTLITLSMGVSETAKRAHLASEKSTYTPPGEGRDYLLAGANWASIVFPLLLALIPILRDDMPLLPVLIIVAIQSLQWFLVDGNLSKTIYYLCLFIGFLLPVAIASVTLFNIPPTFVSGENGENIGIFLGLIALTVAILLATKIIPIPNFSEIDLKNRSFLDYKNRFLFFLCSLFALMLLSVFVALGIRAISDGDIAINKAYEIMWFCVVMIIIISVIYYLKSKSMGGCEASLEKFIDEAEMEDNSNSDTFSKIKYVLVSSRPSTSMIAGVLVFSIVYKASLFTVFDSICLGLAYVFLTMYGFVINDVFDYEKDKKAGRSRPIAMDLLKREDGLRAAFALLIFPFLVSLFYYESKSFSVLLSAVVLLFMYSYISRNYPITKGIITSILCLSPILYSTSMIGYSASNTAYAAIFIFIFGRELFLDSKDYDGDKLSALKTLPYYFGVGNSKAASWTLMFAGTGLFLFSKLSAFGCFLAIFAFATLLISFLASFKNEEFSMTFSRLTMLSGAFLFSFMI